jgi:hypothetical protein
VRRDTDGGCWLLPGLGKVGLWAAHDIPVARASCKGAKGVKATAALLVELSLNLEGYSAVLVTAGQAIATTPSRTSIKVARAVSI